MRSLKFGLQSCQERITDGQRLFDDLTVLQIFGIDGCAVAFERYGDYQAVVKRKPVAVGNLARLSISVRE